VGTVNRTSAVWKGHIPALDGVRGLAVIMVLVFHFIGGMEPTSRLEGILCKVLLTGANGVELFFVLSGFLITGILFDARTKPQYFRNFYMRRFLRIFPLYYGVLTALFFVAPAIPLFQGPELDYLRQRQAWAWLYGVNVYIASHGAWSLSYIDHFWSLCIEEHFYLVWPLVVWLLAGNPRRLMWVSALLATGAMAARVIGYASGLNWWTTYVFTPFRLDGLALGGCLAVLARQPRGLEIIARNVPRAAIVAGTLTAITFAWVKVSEGGRGFVYPIRSSLFIVLLAILLMWAITTPERSLASRFFRSRFMVAAGTYSYGLYVYHHFISYYLGSHKTEFALARHLGSHLVAVVLQGMVGMLVSAGVAYASYELFEKRFLSLKRFFESSAVSPKLAADPGVAAPR
jgi:peptidoglycan/LPS O-acetylase OafA/YrhL